MNDNSFEKFPGSNIESQGEQPIPPEQDFAKSMSEGVPEFAGEQFGVANEKNQFYGESVDEQESEAESNEGIASAASIINYGLDAVAREKGVESVVQGIKSFDANGSENPLRDLFIHLGLNNLNDFEEARDEAAATRQIRNAFRDEYNMPRTQNRSKEGALKAIADMKELIAEVEGADPRYAELRNAAASAEKGYFEYAVKDYGKKGLTELFATLNEQKKPKTTTPEETQEETQKETQEETQEETIPPEENSSEPAETVL